LEQYQLTQSKQVEPTQENLEAEHQVQAEEQEAAEAVEAAEVDMEELNLYNPGTINI
jgi:isoaspartyl peptidase/L-asparaginase-like protein (Ntn-hydrolase superfamily)